VIPVNPVPFAEKQTGIFHIRSQGFFGEIFHSLRLSCHTVTFTFMTCQRVSLPDNKLLTLTCSVTPDWLLSDVSGTSASFFDDPLWTCITPDYPFSLPPSLSCDWSRWCRRVWSVAHPSISRTQNIFCTIYVGQAFLFHLGVSSDKETQLNLRCYKFILNFAVSVCEDRNRFGLGIIGGILLWRQLNTTEILLYSKRDWTF
jgi:hypothetical protein